MIFFMKREWIDWIKKYCKHLELKTSEKDAGLRQYIKGLVKDTVEMANMDQMEIIDKVKLDTDSK